MQINRLFEITYILMNKKIVTAKELSKYLEVSQRTIYRDIEILCQSGIPIYTTKGKGGGISLINNFVLNKSIISQQEQKEILVALEGLNVLKYPDIEKITSRLNNFFGNQQTNWIEVDFSDWDNKQKELFSTIKTSIINRTIIKFEYYNSLGQNNIHKVCPIKLWFKKNSWYLKAFLQAPQEFRTFKIKRIKNLQLTDEYFEQVDCIEEQNPESNEYNTINLKLNISQHLAYRVYDEFELPQIQKNDDGSFTVTKSYIENEWLYGYILSFSYYAKVLEPIHIKKIIDTHIKNLKNIYS